MTTTTTDVHNLGSYNALKEVWEKYPEGGGTGDYVFIDGVRYNWDKYEKQWLTPVSTLDKNIEVFDISTYDFDANDWRKDLPNGTYTIISNNESIGQLIKYDGKFHLYGLVIITEGASKDSAKVIDNESTQQAYSAVVYGGQYLRITFDGGVYFVNSDNTQIQINNHSKQISALQSADAELSNRILTNASNILNLQKWEKSISPLSGVKDAPTQDVNKDEIELHCNLYSLEDGNDSGELLVTLSAATNKLAGVMSAADKVKLDETLPDEIAQLQTEMSNVADTELPVIKSMIATNKETIERHDIRITEAEKDISVNATNISTNKETITAIGEQVTKNVNNIADHETRLTAAEGKLTTHTNNIKDISIEVDDQHTALNKHAEQIATNEAAIATNAADIARINDKCDDMADTRNPVIADARLRLGVTWFNYQFRIHGTGIKTTDEVRLYRNVHGVSKWVYVEGDTGKKTVKGWHELKFVSDRNFGMHLISPYLTEASDLAGPTGTNPRINEVEVHVRVPGFVPTWGNIAGDYGDEYDDDLNHFFADFFLAVHPDTNYLNIRHGRRCKSIGITGDEVYKSMARSVEWAIRIFRDGKPITDFLPWKWLVETMPDISAPMDIRSALEGGDLKLSAVSASHQMSASGGSSTGFPVDGVLTGTPILTRGTDDVKMWFDYYEFEDKESRDVYTTISAADSQKAGVMSTTMYDLLLKAFATAIQTKYQGQNVVVLSYNSSLYTDSTADFNGQTYTLTDSLCVFDLGTKKTIINSTANERKFIKAITDVWYLPDGITSYASAFNSGSSNYNPFRVHVKIDLSQCTDISSMFCNQLGLTSLDVSDWDVSKIQNFRYAIALTRVTKLDVSKWDVSNCPTLRSIWASSPVIDPIDTSNWVTTNCTNFGCLFQDINAEYIDVSSFDTSKATAMDFMFARSSNVKVITGLTNFDTSKVTTFLEMFYGLGNVTLDLSSFSLESATNVSNMFRFIGGTQVVTLGPNFFNAPKITSIDLTYISTSTELKQSLINCYDRKTAGQDTLTLMLSTSMKNALTDAEKAAITAKGYTIK